MDSVNTPTIGLRLSKQINRMIEVLNKCWALQFVKYSKEMIHTTHYTSPDLETIEVSVEEGYALSGVELPDFENENDI